MVLGKLPVPGRPTILITVGQGPIALAVGAGGVVLTFLLSSIHSPLSPSLWETARYRLKYCLKGPLNPKQPTIYVTKRSLMRKSSPESEFCSLWSEVHKITNLKLVTITYILQTNRANFD